MTNVERMPNREKWSKHSAFFAMSLSRRRFDQSETLGLHCRSYRLPRRSFATAGRRRVIRHLLSILRFMGHVSFYATGDLPWQF
jgi:hypothetical protein